MIKSNAFDYINVLDKAADASWLRNQAIANNIANVDTPGYKREDITFEKELFTLVVSYKGGLLIISKEVKLICKNYRD